MAAPEIRIVDGDEKEAARRVVAMGFGGDPDGPGADEEREGWAGMVSHAALVDGEVVGHTGAFDFTMTVPGSSARVAGVTNVGVSASARRRGVGSALLRTQLADSHRAGFVAAALWASEPRIYGRYGYGAGSDLLALTIPRDQAALRVVEGADAVRLRFVGLDEGRAVVADLQHRESVERPGLFPWDERWVRRLVRDDPDSRDGASPLRILAADRGGDPTGYAMWRNEHVWGGGRPEGTVRVQDYRARDAATAAAIWRLLLDYDLMSTTTVRLPVDDRLLSLLEDYRCAVPRLTDALHVRVLDVGAALGARRYPVEVGLVVGVRDPVCPWNDGAWRLTGGPDGSTCVRTDAPVDVDLGVRELGALYLGGRSARTLARAGLVHADSDALLRRFDSAMRWDPAPHSDAVF